MNRKNIYSLNSFKPFHSDLKYKPFYRMPTPTGCVYEQSRMPLKIRKYSCAFLIPRSQYNAWLPHNKKSNQKLKGMRQGKAFEFDPSQNRIRTLRTHVQPKSTILMHTELAKQSEVLWRTAAASRDQTLSCDKRINLWKPWSRCLINSVTILSLSVCMLHSCYSICQRGHRAHLWFDFTHPSSIFTTLRTVQLLYCGQNFFSKSA